jgi:hypothetical protein
MNLRVARRLPTYIELVLPLAALLHIAQGSLFADGLETIVTGVDTVWAGGGVGPVMGLNEGVTAIVAGDEYTASIPSIAAVASTSGNGRAVGFGQEGFFTDQHIGLFDNLRIATNAVSWLDLFHRKRVLIVTNHGEWCGYSTTILQNRLTELGYSVALSNGPITGLDLQGAGVLFAGNIWGSITSQEMTAIKDFFDGGGGLFLMGVGWSWVSSNPASTLDDYPMNQIGALCGIRWIDGGISDDVHKSQDYPLFLHYYPETWISLQTVPGAMSYISSATSAHSADLPSALQSDSTFRAQYIVAHAILAWGLGAGISSYPRQIYDFYSALVTTHPQFFHKDFAYNMLTESAILQIRERVARTLSEALPLTPELRGAIASTLNLTGRCRDIWTGFSVLLMDNSGLNAAQTEFLYEYFSSLPAGLQNLSSISVADFLGSTTPPVNLSDAGGNINIVGWSIGSATGNSFPDDIPPVTTDVFCIIVAHEVNHAVDHFTVGNNAVLMGRRKALILAAGDDSLNYLRSMCAPGFFTNAPQEFVASIANEWFTDSRQTMGLGLARFAGGRAQPLNQAIFFADVYSRGRDSTFFYRIDSAGHLSRETILLTRDARGHINSMRLDDGWRTFSLDTAGNVLDVALPIQLASFDVTALASKMTRLQWMTVSETNNYGFEVQVSGSSGVYVSVPGVFIPGHGTTTEPHEYAWIVTGNPPELRYRLKQIDLDGAVHYSEGKKAPSVAGNTASSGPAEFALLQNYPNPFNPTTTIRYSLPHKTQVLLAVFNTLGQQIATLAQGELEAGSYEVRFDGSALASGLYFYRIQAGGFVQSRRFLLLR